MTAAAPAVAVAAAAGRDSRRARLEARARRPVSSSPSLPVPTRSMRRTIEGFRLDEERHWVAALDCGHARHVRHDPPLVERAWVLDARLREARIGTPLDCVRCDRRELPDHFRETRRTRRFTEATVPNALRRSHSTRRGVWGVLHVHRGRLAYRQHAPFDDECILEAGQTGLILPEVEHEVEPLGPVEFEIAFHAAPPPDEADPAP